MPSLKKPNIDKLLPGKPHSRYDHDPSAPVTLDDAERRFIEAKIDLETRVTPGAEANLEEAKAEYIRLKTIEIKGGIPAGSTPEDIALATHSEFINFEREVMMSYTEKLDQRSKLTKLDATVGKWLNGGGKLGKWAKNASVSSGVGFATGFGIGFAGSAATGFLPTAAITAVVAGVKAGIRKEALIEENGALDRQIIEEDGHKSRIEDFAKTTANQDEIIKYALRMLSNESAGFSAERQKNIRKQVVTVLGATALGSVLGYAVEHTAAGDFVAEKVGNLIDSAKDATEPKLESLYFNSPGYVSRIGSYIERIPGISFGDDGTDVGNEPEDTGEQLPADADTGNDQTGAGDTEEQPTGAGTIADGGDRLAGVDPADSGDQPVDLTGDDAEEAGDQGEGTDNKPPILEATLPPLVGFEALTDTVVIHAGEGVTGVLGNVLEGAGHPDVPPEQLFEIYEGLINNPNIGPDGIFEGDVVLEQQPNGEYWIMGNPTETSLTPGAADWIQNNFAEIRGDVEVIEDIEAVDAADADAAPEVVAPTLESLTQPVTIEPGDGITHALGKALSSAGYENVPPEQLFMIYEGLVTDSAIDPTHILEGGATIEWNAEAGQFWIIGEAPFDARLSPVAAEWVSDNFAEVQASYEAEVAAAIEPVDTAEIAPTEEVVDAGHEVHETAKTPVDGQAQVGEEYPAGSISEVSEFNNFTIQPGDGVTHVLDDMYTALGYDLTEEQLLAQYHGLVYSNGPIDVGALNIFEGPVEMYYDAANDNYRIANEAPFVANFTPDAIEWLENNPPTLNETDNVPDDVAADGNSIPADNAAEIVSDTEALTGAITVESGNGVTDVLGKVFENAGYENVPPEVLNEVYLGMINDQHIGPDGIFDGATLYHTDVPNQWWIEMPEGVTSFEASLTPEAANWVEVNMPQLLEDYEAQIDLAQAA